LPEFQSQFSTEEACQKYLASCRWPDGFVCPRCGNQSAYELVKLKLWQCTGCRHQVSVTAQTILHNTKHISQQGFATIGKLPSRHGICEAGECEFQPFFGYEPNFLRNGSETTRSVIL
jgi:ribosomal protein L37AE/L43A